MIENILFDLDGTLTDPKEGIVNSIVYALEKLGIKEEAINELDSFIGPPLRESFMERYKLSEALTDRAIEYYRRYFSKKGIFENKPYEGVDDMLESLFSDGFRLFVATSKPTGFATEIMRYFNLEKYFIEIYGSSLDNSRTGKTEIISGLLSARKLDPERSAMVGDRKHDIIGAKNNSIISVGVTYGYGSVQELSSQSPDFMVKSCKELKSLFLKLKDKEL